MRSRFRASTRSLISFKHCHENTLLVVIVDHHEVLELGIAVAPDFHVIDAAILSGFMASHLFVKRLDL